MKNFIKKIEDFICEFCKAEVIGTGYTNYCPICLFSKHVDKEIPDNRKSKCFGLMEPIGVDKKNQDYILIHRCKKCKKISRNKISSEDNFEKILELSKSPFS